MSSIYMIISQEQNMKIIIDWVTDGVGLGLIWSEKWEKSALC